MDGIELTIESGAVYGLLGPNGAGSTTAIRAITTLLPVPPGMVSVSGRDVSRERMEVRRLLGYVPRQLFADAGLTGRENIAMFARLFDVPRKQRDERVAAALDSVSLPDVASPSRIGSSAGAGRSSTMSGGIDRPPHPKPSEP